MTAQTALEPVIGLEVHAQLTTASKMFCACSAQYAGAAPNTHVCEVCAAMPGALPVINRRAVESTILTALALECTVPPHSKFDRKNYSYPDLPKGYQISQYDSPLARQGWLEYAVGDQVRRCGITRVHLEEDTGKSTHTAVGGKDVSLVDYNRSGVPLMEIVTEPEISSPDEARSFFETLRQLLVYLEVCDGKLQEGSMRADVNVSLRRPDGSFGDKVEIKNLNSFRNVQHALAFEVKRQAEALARGERIVQETRLWDADRGDTKSMRSKEFAHDYRYFPEPDLVPLRPEPETVERLGAELGDLPGVRIVRLADALGFATAQTLVMGGLDGLWKGMSGENGDKGNYVQHKHPSDSDRRKRNVVAECCKEVFCYAANDISRARMPAHRYIVLRDSDARAKAGLLHEFSQLHVVQHFEAKRLIGADPFVNLAADEVKRANSHVILGFRIGDFPGAMPEDEHGLKEGDHHEFAGTLHDHLRK